MKTDFFIFFLIIVSENVFHVINSQLTSLSCGTDSLDYLIKKVNIKSHL
jgi:hypothetical protein